MGTDIDNVALVHDHDARCLEHSCKPVCDDYGGAIFHQSLECFLDNALALGIERTRRLVQQQDRRVFQYGSRYRNALPLTTRKTRAAFTQERFITVGQVANEVVRRGRYGGGFNVTVACAGLP